MLIIPAKIASPGLAIGKVVLFEKKDYLQQASDSIDNVDLEIGRLNAGLESATHRIKQSKINLKGQLEAEELAIFDAHLEIIKDPELVGQSKNLISNQRKSLEQALQVTSQQFIDQLLALDDDYFKARAKDIEDVVKIIVECCNEEMGDLMELDEPSIIVCEDLSPHLFATMDTDKISGVINQGGGLTDHMSIICRSMGIPSLVGAENILSIATANSKMILDGLEGKVVLDPDNKVVIDYKERLDIENRANADAKKGAHLPGVTKSGTSIKVYANVGSLHDARNCLENGAEGIGLLRTELCFLGVKAFPSEEEHYSYYKSILDELKGREVVIRLLDFGSDKKVPYITHYEEENPALGCRALRLGFEYIEELLKPQINAILRLTADYNISILCPMIATLEDVTDIRNLIESIGATLTSRKIGWNKATPIGIMVEVPYVAFFIRDFIDHVDFLSFGTNDLAQFLMAADRTNPKVSGYLDKGNEGIVKLVEAAINAAHKKDKWVGICGELASDMRYIHEFLDMGVDELSMPSHMIPRVKAYIRNMN